MRQTLIITELITAVIQIGVMAIIPIIWWLCSARKSESFFTWIGLKKPHISEKKKFLFALFVAIIIAVLMSLITDAILPDNIELANSRFGGLGFSALLPAIIFAFLSTGLAEEILFRGFLGKRLCNKFGFAAGNTIQAVMFGLLHGAAMFGSFGVFIPLTVIVFTGALGWLMGYINEKSDGSIIPSWTIHGFSNLYAAIIIMFNLL
jgi:membrane protease YdiL (CAAX protease family)